MPKLKSHRGGCKRFRRTASGKFRRQHAYTGHLQGKKTADRKRRLRESTLVADADQRRLKKLIPG
jgi:large subunit ribosomal protein L35